MSIANQPAFPHVVPGAITEPNHHAGMTYHQGAYSWARRWQVCRADS